MDNNRAEAERWLGVAERLLASRDLHGTRTFAIRVRDFNPILADQILAVADTLLAAQSDPLDWYRILQLQPFTSSAEIVATQYRKFALLLNPASNHLLYADQAYRLVSDAWSVLSNPSKKAIYDNELRLGQLGQAGFMTQLGLASPLDQMAHLGQQQHHPPQQHQQPPQMQQQYQQQQQSQREGMTSPVRPSERVIQFSQLQEQPQHQQMQTSMEPPVRKNPRSKDGRATLEEERPIVNSRTESAPQTQPIWKNQSNQPAESTPLNEPTPPKVSSFWTACPYCFILYEYPKVYEECCLRCQKCKRAFHAATIPTPPLSGNDTHFCCWGFFPVGTTGKKKNSGPYVYYDDDDIFVDLSDVSDDSDDDDWQQGSTKRARNTRSSVSAAKSGNKPQGERVRKGTNLDGDGSMASESVPVAEASRRVPGSNGRRQMRSGAKDLGKLDLNVEFSNDVEEATAGRKGGNAAGVGVEDNIEGNGFFEGLDEFLSSLPILNVVDDKVKAA